MSIFLSDDDIKLAEELRNDPDFKRSALKAIEDYGPHILGNNYHNLPLDLCIHTLAIMWVKSEVIKIIKKHLK